MSSLARAARSALLLTCLFGLAAAPVRAESLALVLRDGALIHGDLAHAGARVFKVTRGDLPAVAAIGDLTEIAGAGLFVHGAASPLPCPGPAGDWRALLEEAARASGQPGRAPVQAVERAAAAMACGPDLVPGDAVRRLKALAGALPGAPAGTLLLDVFATPGTDGLYLDGVPQLDPERGGADVPPGIHLVQFVRGGRVDGVALWSVPGRAVVSDPGIALAAVRDRQIDRPAWTAGSALLRAASRRWVADRIYLVGPGRKGAVWSFDPMTGEMRQIARGKAP